MNTIKLFTIGFTKRSASDFFNTLIQNNIKLLIDIRLNNESQLAGYTKKKDLKYFLEKIGNISYKHLIELAPTQEILDDYKKNKIDWNNYKSKFNKLIEDRKIENIIDINSLNMSCLLCSEYTSEKCHRNLVAEYLKLKNKNIEIIHL